MRSHSLRSAFMGLANAARMAWKLTVRMAMDRARAPARPMERICKWLHGGFEYFFGDEHFVGRRSREGEGVLKMGYGFGVVEAGIELA